MLNFDIDELDNMINDLDRTIKNEEKVVNNLKKSLYISVHLLSFLKMNIGKEVYNQRTDDADAVAVDPNSNDPSPNELYHRTGDLMRSARIQMTDRGLMLYMDDEWLGDQPQAKLNAFEQMQQGYSWKDEYGELIPSFGEAVNAHNGEGYSLRVEEGFTYHNVNIRENRKDTVEPRPFMEVTFDGLEKELDKVKKERLLDILVDWARRG